MMAACDHFEGRFFPLEEAGRNFPPSFFTNLGGVLTSSFLD
jgi:hypothetical protein